MLDSPFLVLALFAGVVLGTIFFGGLWWTVCRGLSSKNPAFWFFGSFLLRMGITLLGFYLVGRGHWDRLVACLLGFVIARIVVSRLTNLSGRKQSLLAQEARHATES